MIPHCHRIKFNFLSKQVKHSTIWTQLFLYLIYILIFHTTPTLAQVPLVKVLYLPGSIPPHVHTPKSNSSSNQLWWYPPSMNHLLLPLKSMIFLSIRSIEESASHNWLTEKCPTHHPMMIQQSGRPLSLLRRPIP